MNYFSVCCRKTKSKVIVKAKHVTKVHSVTICCDSVYAALTATWKMMSSCSVFISNNNKILSLEDTVPLQQANCDAIRFQFDIGSDVNVLPPNIYELATGNYQLVNVRSLTLSNLTVYTVAKVKVVGQV